MHKKGVLFKFLAGADRKKFDNHWAKLKDANRIKEVTDYESVNKFLLDNIVITFECNFWEDEVTQMGLMSIDDKHFFIVGVKDCEIILFDKLSKFLKIK